MSMSGDYTVTAPDPGRPWLSCCRLPGTREEPQSCRPTSRSARH